MNLPARAGKIESRIVMKTEFKGELCVYCGTPPADTADHVVCKQFFLENRRDNLPQAPACSACNNEKSKLELYLTTVLAFGGRHPDAAANLATKVPKRLKKNAKLLRELKAGFDKSGGKTVPLDSARLNQLFAMIARGLAWYHWKVRLGTAYSANASAFNDAGEPFFDNILSQLKTPNRVKGDLGEKTFVYEGAQSPDSPELTIWKFKMYGPILLGGDPNIPGSVSLTVAVTGRSDLVSKLGSNDHAGGRPTIRRNSMKIGRNDQCPCGSGKKYKKCHGAATQAPAKPSDRGRSVRLPTVCPGRNFARGRGGDEASVRTLMRSPWVSTESQC
jgi:hypothetical protein